MVPSLCREKSRKKVCDSSCRQESWPHISNARFVALDDGGGTLFCATVPWTAGTRVIRIPLLFLPRTTSVPPLYEGARAKRTAFQAEQPRDGDMIHACSGLCLKRVTYGRNGVVRTTANYRTVPDVADIQFVFFCEIIVIRTGRSHGRESCCTFITIKVCGQARCAAPQPPSDSSVYRGTVECARSVLADHAYIFICV